eukprot:m.270029 g.270029  ORF g.270029 m.270029 type:complete len:71 (+) comp16261_c0_seq8:431-643(+)
MLCCLKCNRILACVTSCLLQCIQTQNTPKSMSDVAVNLVCPYSPFVASNNTINTFPKFVKSMLKCISTFP